MEADSAGEIGLDLVLNQNNFEKQLSGIRSIAQRAGATLAAAFAVKKVVDFGKSCVDLGSDLAEVQNVVDVTFTSMNKQVDKFAKNAITQFGLSETMAKRYTGTFGAMAKAFGFGEQQAYDMSTALTGLAGDVASFYNISQDEAYTKLKSVFTGETESLKDLGVVMTQTALDSYALANGFGKTTAKMSEAEKVALRYKFVQEQLTTAAGDFSRTSDGWANQVRILSLQFDSLKASIGQGLINALTPVIKVINTIISRLVVLANYFKAFTTALFGNAREDIAATTATNMASAASSADAAAKAAAKANKAIGASAGIDEFNLIKQPDAASGSGGETGVGGVEIPAEEETGSAALDMNTSGVENAALRVRKAFDGLRVFMAANKTAILATVGGLVAAILTYFVATNWGEITTGISVAFGGIGKSIVKALGGISPMAVIISAVIGLIVAGIIDLWNTSDTFRANMQTCWSVIATAFSKGWEILWNDGLKPLGEALANLGKMLGEFYESSGLKTLFEVAITALAGVATFVTSVLIMAVSGALTLITAAIAALIQLLAGIINKVLWVKDNWTSIWSNIGTFFVNLWNSLCSAVSGAVASIGKAVSSGWATISTATSSAWNAIVTDLSQAWASICQSISTSLGNISTGISNALTTIKGGWINAWTALKNTTKQIFSQMWSSIKGIINNIIGGVEKMVNSVIKGINKMISAVNNVADHIPGVDADLIPTISTVSLPRLASGGFVRANTPQLAMIGDNRHHGEIVAPEDKMQDMVNRAVAMASGSNMSDQYLMIMIELLKDIISLIERMDLTVKIDIRDVKKKLVELDKRSGHTLRTT